MEGIKMNLSDNLITLRKSRGYSQEQLANKLNVSRQSVSKWESGQSTPDLDRLLEIAQIFNITLDTLIHGEQVSVKTEKTTLSKEDIQDIIQQSFGYEYKSNWRIGKIPIIHINIGRGMRVAKGIFAVGNVAVGLFSLGGLATGILSIGGASLGLLSLGGFAIGGFAVGGLAVGIYAAGGVAIAKEFAIGAMARGDIAIGTNVKGNHTLITKTQTTGLEIKKFILQHLNTRGWIRNIIQFLIP